MWLVVSSPDMGATPQILKITSLEAEPGFVHGFSTTSLGSMGLTHAPDPEVVLASRRHFARALGIDAEPLTVAGAVHGREVARVDEHVDVVMLASDAPKMQIDRPSAGEKERRAQPPERIRNFK